MKYITIIGDGMSEDKIITPLQAAKKPTIDMLAQYGILGTVKTVPNNMYIGSDTANLSIMGYNPLKYYTGRSSFEAYGMGINFLKQDISLRCNFVTLSNCNNYKNCTLYDYTAGNISTQESSELIKALNQALKSKEIQFYKGSRYKHCMIWHNGQKNLNLTPPQDIVNKKINNYIPDNNILASLMEKSYIILKNHSINKIRTKNNLNTANSIWFWGEGQKPYLPDFFKFRNLKGSVISGVEIIKGIGICSGMNNINVKGATGDINTNFYGKYIAAVNEISKGQDYIYIHIEAPDECSHRGDLKNKIKSIELIDEKIINPLIKYLSKKNYEYSILIMPDHNTSTNLRVHTYGAVPFVIYRSNDIKNSGFYTYTEKTAKAANLYINNACQLFEIFTQKQSL